MKKEKINRLNFVIDKLTNSIENVKTGDSFKTEISLLTKEDIKIITKKKGWLFDWKSEFRATEREVFKLTILEVKISKGCLASHLEMIMFISI